MNIHNNKQAKETIPDPYKSLFNKYGVRIMDDDIQTSFVLLFSRTPNGSLDEAVAEDLYDIIYECASKV